MRHVVLAGAAPSRMEDRITSHVYEDKKGRLPDFEVRQLKVPELDSHPTHMGLSEAGGISQRAES